MYATNEIKKKFIIKQDPKNFFNFFSPVEKHTKTDSNSYSRTTAL
jgi:hypothetical protein